MASSKLSLLTLPDDVHLLIAAFLQTAPYRFPPRYSNQLHYSLEDEGAPNGSCLTNYGRYSANDEACAAGLINWSCTCKRFRSLLSSSVFSSITLRTAPKSLDSIQALTHTNHWQAIRSFIIAGTFPSTDELERCVTNERYFDKIDLEVLVEVLCNLPPNLQNLTLDFPTCWANEHDFDYLDVQEETAADVAKAESVSKWRNIINVVLHSVSMNDFSAKDDFVLNLFNLPPLACSTYHQGQKDASFACLLRSARSFTIRFADLETKCPNEQKMCSMYGVPSFTSKLDTFFFNHLHRVRSLSIYACEDLHLGQTEAEDSDIHLPLPSSSDFMPQIEELYLENVFLCPSLVDFIKSHKQTIRSITMNDCWAWCGCPDETCSMHWEEFFDSIAFVRPTALTDLSVTYSTGPGKRLEDWNPLPNYKPSTELLLLLMNFQERVELQWTTREMLFGCEKTGDQAAFLRVLSKSVDKHEADGDLSDHYLSPEGQHSKKLYGYRRADEEDEINWSPTIEATVQRFEDGVDHRAWLRLLEVMERNKQRTLQQESSIATG